MFGLEPAAGPTTGLSPDTGTGAGAGAAALPRQLDDIDSLRDGARIVGRLRAVVGNEVLLDHADQTLVLSGRTLGGWPIGPTTTFESGGYSTSPIRDTSGPPEPALF